MTHFPMGNVNTDWSCINKGPNPLYLSMCYGCYDVTVAAKLII